jgi:D-inositol-3-phosphate glycosyltransferase
MEDKKEIIGEMKPITLRVNSSDITMSKKKPIRILWYSDFLRHTGFGNVAEELISRLSKTGKYEFVVVGINYNGVPYCTPASEYFHLKDIPVYPAFTGGPQSSLFGYDVVAEFLKSQKFDIFFALQDTFNLIPLKEAITAAKKHKNFKYILYFPVDGDIHTSWIEDAIKLADIPVTYSDFGKKIVTDKNPYIDLMIVPHGVDLDTFKPFETKEERTTFRKTYFNIEDDVFLITNVNRNQPRKDLPRTIIAFKKFCEENKDIKARLYLHCSPQDGAGHKLHEFTKNYLPEELWDRVIMPSDMVMGGNGIPVETLSMVYAASDLVTSTTYGEGWGLSTVEAMASKTPVVMPNNSVNPQLLGKNEERGYLVKSGGDDLSDYNVMKYDNELMRPLTDVNDLVSKWKHVYDNKEEAKQKAEVAYEWLQDFTWDKIVKQWEEIFDNAIK